MFIKWQEMFAVGHLELDVEHKRLVGFINRINEAQMESRANHILDLLSGLHFAAMEHFRHENSLMRDIIAGA